MYNPLMRRIKFKHWPSGEYRIHFAKRLSDFVKVFLYRQLLVNRLTFKWRII